MPLKGKIITILTVLAPLGVAALIIGIIVFQVNHTEKNLADSTASSSPVALSNSVPVEGPAPDPASAASSSETPDDPTASASVGEIEYQGETVPLLWTDDTTGENLIIKTDRKYYDASAQTVVFFSVANESALDQTAALYFWFDSGAKSLASVEKIGPDAASAPLAVTSDFPLPSFPNRKSVNDYTQGSKFQDTILAGATNSYRALIASANTSGQSEFFLEAIGDQGGYGHLDPYLTGGLVGYWSFNGPTIAGNSVYDQSGNYATGTMSGGPTKAIGISGQSLSLDGTDDAIAIDSFNSTTQNYTFSFWVKRINNKFVFDSLDGRLTIDFGLYAPNDGYLSFSDGSWKSLFAVPANEWHHIALVLNSSNSSATGYLDGVASGNASYSGVNIGTMTKIGSHYEQAVSLYQGFLDEVRVYNRALTATEIQQLYRLGSAKNINR